MKNKIDPIEIDTVHSNIFTKVIKFLKRNFYTICNTIIVIGLIVVIFSPFIIDYFTK
jgi:hypothetical protein